jgi:hypothetical protein
MHHELRDPVVQPRVAGEVGPVAEQDVVSPRSRALEPELGVLRQGAYAVGRGRRRQQRQDVSDVGCVQGAAQTSWESTTFSADVARAAAAEASATC